MSRCFPYPPPGYLRQGLVESTKLERENVLPKTEQKLHKKKEKKQRKKESQRKDRTESRTKKFKKLDDCLNVYKDDQLENSDLTEEHEPPACYISDGSQNSNKRKRETLSYSECRVNGNIVKIRFSLKKPREPDAYLSEQPVFTSVRVDSAQEQCYHSSIKANTITSVPEQNISLDEERRDRIHSSSGTSANDSEMQKAALQYKGLIEDWMPPPFLVKRNDDDNDVDWLFMTKLQGKRVAKTSKVDNVVTYRASGTSCPRAYFLPEAEIYALPYTVPF